MRLLVVGALVALTLPSAAAGAPARWLTVTAGRSAYAVVRLDRPTTLLLPDPGDPGPQPVVSGGGGTAGVLLTPLAAGRPTGPSVGLLVVGTQRLPLGPERVALPAGSYLLRVVASAPVTVRLPVTGAARRWTPTRPLATRTSAATWTAPAGPLLLGAAPATLGPSSLALLTLDHDTAGTGEDTTACLTTADRCGDDDAWTASTATARTLPASERTGMVAVAEGVRAGAYTARWRVVVTGAATAPAASVLVVG